VAVLDQLPSVRPAPRIVIGGPGWGDEIPKPAIHVEDLVEACEEILRAVGA
jgi:hypothetical protein